MPMLETLFRSKVQPLYLLFATAICFQFSSLALGLKPNIPTPTKHSPTSRRHFVSATGVLLSSLALRPGKAFPDSYQTGITFEGGAGGLSKKSADTGVQRLGLTISTLGASGGKFLDEVELPGRSDGATALVVYDYPPSWKCSNKLTAIDTRDLGSGDSAFVVVRALPPALAAAAAGDVPAALIKGAVFGKEGKFGAYGAPEDVKIKSDVTESATRRSLRVSFSTYTPAMRLVLKESYITVCLVDSVLFILVASSSKARAKEAGPALAAAAASFRAARAPDSNAAQRRLLRAERQQQKQTLSNEKDNEDED
mmetsp:Transcript_40806/g.67509  ORF Transcript_40806/g.67509 Transcript_40806/m.67509 type:complete len:311 (-) Transcript_40806:296-1228(-)